MLSNLSSEYSVVDPFRVTNDIIALKPNSSVLSSFSLWHEWKLKPCCTFKTIHLLFSEDDIRTYIYAFFPIPATSPWRWRQHGPLKRWYPAAALHGVTTRPPWKPQISQQGASWCGVFFEKLIVPHSINKLIAFIDPDLLLPYGWTLSWVCWIQFTP